MSVVAVMDDSGWPGLTECASMFTASARIAEWNGAYHTSVHKSLLDTGRGATSTAMSPLTAQSYVCQHKSLDNPWVPGRVA
jgi:hypothetical protein